MRIYIDTSVFGGYFDEEFSIWSQLLFNQFIDGKRIAVISDLTLEELNNAPEIVSNLCNDIPQKFIEKIKLDESSIQLANFYIKEKVVTKKSIIDARHIALATINKVDILVSWNFKHIVNYDRIRLYNSVNLKYGYSIIDIRNPRDLSDEN